ncbi:MAG: hypothetical protein K2Q45_09000 [Nitrosomonas sp.]|nr:hypothetical protein [Nitrosomonas sp.]
MEIVQNRHALILDGVCCRVRQKIASTGACIMKNKVCLIVKTKRTISCNKPFQISEAVVAGEYIQVLILHLKNHDSHVRFRIQNPCTGNGMDFFLALLM